MHTTFTVTDAEAGQKLLQCLARRLHEPLPVLHRWIRTGQVRVNGSRRKPFDRIMGGDEIRLPPFAVQAVQNGGHETTVKKQQAASRLQSAHSDSCSWQTADEKIFPDSPARTKRIQDNADVLPLLFLSSEIVVVNKPCGLPTQPGTKHGDSVVQRLRRMFPDDTFAPTPAHRLDRDTSGILFAARSYSALRRLAEAFASRQVCKEYLAWCAGIWPYQHTIRVDDTLIRKITSKGQQRMSTATTGNTYPHDKSCVQLPSVPIQAKDCAKPQEAAMLVTPVLARNGATLLHIRLLTGRMHQIRAQLAARNVPLVGDGKYGGKKAFAVSTPPRGMLLHACRTRVAELCVETLPPWSGIWKVKQLPAPFVIKDQMTEARRDSVPPSPDPFAISKK